MMGLSTLSFATPAIWFLFTGYLAFDIPQHLALPVLVTLDSRFEYFPLCRYRHTCKWCSKFTFVRFNLNESWFPNLRTLFLNCLMNNQHRLGTDLMLQLKRAGHSFLITLVIVMEVRYSSTGTETKMIHWSCWYCQSGKRTTLMSGELSKGSSWQKVNLEGRLFNYFSLNEGCKINLCEDKGKILKKFDSLILSVRNSWLAGDNLTKVFNQFIRFLRSCNSV